LTGLLAAAQWSGAASMVIPGGKLLVQNDATHLYIGIDLTSETGAANANDYFYFYVDINNNGVINANRDLLFSVLPGNQNRLYKFYLLGPNTNTGVNPSQVIPSLLKSGFGASLDSATAHRQWQISFALSDLGIDPIDPTGPSPVVDFGLVTGTVGGSSSSSPVNAGGNFAALNSIILACTPSGPVPAGVGPVIATVGLIGTGDIAADGYATITAPYYLNPDHAAFCGTLNFIGNVATLTYLFSHGATKYKVMHRYGATVAAANAATFAPILQAWSNFEIVGPLDVWQSFGPDASGYYTFVNPALPYTIQNLLFQWTTSAEPDGVHQFEVIFYTATNVAVPLPPPVLTQIMTLALDNQAATVDLINILHGGTVVPACAIVNLSSATDGVQLQFEAYDPEGDLLNMVLTAEWGHGSSATIYSDSYAAHASPSHIWQGVTSLTEPASPAVWVPPVTCAYLFQIAAYTRSTNGYSYPIVYASDFQTVTLIKPGSPVVILEKAPALTAPIGMKLPLLPIEVVPHKPL
jgi:hypothetical protein